MKKIILLLLSVLLTACTPSSTTNKNFINTKGTTLETRIPTPKGYTREQSDFAHFLQTYPLKENGSPILLYNGKKKWNQSAQIAVFKIQFHLSDGFLLSYMKWREGYRVVIKNDHASYIKSASYDDSYECFKKYLRIVFAYSGSASMVSESTPIKLNEIRVGDVFLKGGSPGHVVMIVDVCTNREGKKAFLIAQGYMPAQEFHLLKNPSHDDPWYYEDEIKYPFETPDYTFEEGSLRRLCY